MGEEEEGEEREREKKGDWEGTKGVLKTRWKATFRSEGLRSRLGQKMSVANMAFRGKLESILIEKVKKIIIFCIKTGRLYNCE